MPGPTGKAHRKHRGFGCAKRDTHDSHSVCAGHARQTAHWPGRARTAPSIKRWNMDDQYTRGTEHVRRATAFHRPRCGAPLDARGADALAMAA
jgi:hypothetical protein